MQVLHLTEHDFYELHTNAWWLTSFSGDMVIFVFLLRFFSPSYQKRVIKIWIIKRLTKSCKSHKQATNLILLSCAWRCHLSYKRYKVHKYFSDVIQGTQVLVYTNIHYFCIFQIFPLFFIKSKKKKKKNKNKKKEGTNILKRKTRDRKQMAMHERGRERSCQENNTNVLV